jgi:hypothetical protein
MPERWHHELRKLASLETPLGLWHRAVSGPRGELRRTGRSWRAIAPVAAALAVVVVAGTLGLVRALSPAYRPGWVASHRAAHFTDPSYGWSIRVPAGLGTPFPQRRSESDWRRRPRHQLRARPRGFQHRHAADGLAAHVPPRRGSRADLLPAGRSARAAAATRQRVPPVLVLIPAGQTIRRRQRAPSLVSRSLRRRVRLRRGCLDRPGCEPREPARRLGRDAVTALPSTA